MADANEKWLIGIIVTLCTGFGLWVTRNINLLWGTRDKTLVLETQMAAVLIKLDHIDQKLDAMGGGKK